MKNKRATVKEKKRKPIIKHVGSKFLNYITKCEDALDLDF